MSLYADDVAFYLSCLIAGCKNDTNAARFKSDLSDQNWRPIILIDESNLKFSD